MGFASAWLQSASLFPEFISEAPHPGTGIIIVIPSYNETGITNLLGSLENCREPDCKTEVIIVVNSPPGAGSGILANNANTLKAIDGFRRHKKLFFRLFTINIENPPFKKWGVGMARKAGMDEALRRFDKINSPHGIILCLDADCTVSSNYLTAVERDLYQDRERKGCTVYYEHPLSGTGHSREEYNSVLQYELHLRYYHQALRYASFPYVFHTVGSTIGVKALPYMKSGGMNRKQAGEDFYFLQKVVPAGGWFRLNDATVYPSPRASDRVPFGTGMAVSRMVAEGKSVFLTYNPAAFSDLRQFLALCEISFSIKNDEIGNLYNDMPEAFSLFLSADEWCSKITEVKSNSASPESFRKRLYHWFNMFKVVRFLNFSHESFYSRIPAADAAAEIMRLSGLRNFDTDPLALLLYMRRLERNN
jgi:glycosyltransferase involved in cell wall biosynthesis